MEEIELHPLSLRNNIFLFSLLADMVLFSFCRHGSHCLFSLEWQGMCIIYVHQSLLRQELKFHWELLLDLYRLENIFRKCQQRKNVLIHLFGWM